MSEAILIVGESGSGKSTSIRSLDPEETIIINSINKKLPFKGGKEFTSRTTDNAQELCRWLNYIDKEKPEIKNVIIDDFQYIMTNEYMRRARFAGKGNAVFQMYDDISGNAWDVLHLAKELREDLFVFILAHSELGDDGVFKMKTIGKVLDNKVKIEGLYNVVLFSDVNEDGYFFLTQNNNGTTTGKTPMGMFDSLRVPNDLQSVIDAIKKYDDITVEKKIKKKKGSVLSEVVSLAELGIDDPDPTDIMYYIDEEEEL